jgi:hypothetical protein
MFALAVIKQLDIVKDIAPGFIHCIHGRSSGIALTLQITLLIRETSSPKNRHIRIFNTFWQTHSHKINSWIQQYQ